MQETQEVIYWISWDKYYNSPLNLQINTYVLLKSIVGLEIYLVIMNSLNIMTDVLFLLCFCKGINFIISV